MATVDLITGLLGAGKTTFIKGYVKYLAKSGERVAVVENEFGRAGVDTAILKEDDDLTVMELTGGCICCDLKVNFVKTLAKLAETCDRIIVEPSGVFTLGDFFEVMKAPIFKDRVQIGTIATIISGVAQMNEEDEKLFASQVYGTGIIVLNRGASYDGDVPVITDSGFTDADYEAIKNAKPGDTGHKADINHAFIYQSASFAPVIENQDVESVVTSLFAPECGNVLRVKGYIGGFLVNATPGYINIMKAEGTPMLNVIGRNLNRKEIGARL
ncbi:MAG: hypothetical protein FWC71_03420 [Defluviitaleaceae bacterium]|nr:hypothetical protein [Defluviitaleaceae bacterium]